MQPMAIGHGVARCSPWKAMESERDVGVACSGRSVQAVQKEQVAAGVAAVAVAAADRQRSSPDDLQLEICHPDAYASWPEPLRWGLHRQRRLLRAQLAVGRLRRQEGQLKLGAMGTVEISKIWYETWKKCERESF